MAGFKHPILNGNLYIDPGTSVRTCSTLPVPTGTEQCIIPDLNHFFYVKKNYSNTTKQSIEKKTIIQDEHSLPCDGRGNEAKPIAKYMAKEMSANAKSDNAKVMRNLNEDSDFAKTYNACLREWSNKPWYHQLLVGTDYCYDLALSKNINKADAIIKWTLKVAQDAEWDHKPYIRKTFRPAVPAGEQVWHAYDNYLYYYDIWSNIHYGYVGMACGFTKSELLDGAGLEQIGTDLLRRRLPDANDNIKGLRAYDDPSDRESISIGISLYQKNPSHVTSQSILSAIKNAKDITKKPC